jgi:hypothetical protein
VAYSKEHYQANKEVYAAKSKAWRDANKERAKANRKRHYEDNKQHSLEYSRNYTLKRKYNLTEEEYSVMLEKQGGTCAICFSKCTRALAVDHEHATGRVRGLLCNNCNRGIGHLKDDVAILVSAIKYLQSGSCGV